MDRGPTCSFQSGQGGQGVAGPPIQAHPDSRIPICLSHDGVRRMGETYFLQQLPSFLAPGINSLRQC